MNTQTQRALTQVLRDLHKVAMGLSVEYAAELADSTIAAIDALAEDETVTESK